MTLGEKLSRLRKENNYTQEQLADILNVSRQSISKWESDVAYPETDKIIRLCELFHCSMDYLFREDVQERNNQIPSRSEEPSKAVKVLLGILRFTPMALFSLWALLLWAFYAAPLTHVTKGSLYYWFDHGLVFELQPTMRTLVSLGVIACAYIVPLVCLQFFANKKVNFIVSICSVAFHVAIFVCSLCLVGISVAAGLEYSPVGIVVAVLTAVFAQVQTAAVLMNYFFNGICKELRATSDTKSEQKRSNWFKLHKALAISLACVLFVGIVLSIVLPLTVGNIFNASRVSRIQLGDSRDQVVKVLGKPIDVDTDKLAEIVGEDNVSAISKENVYYYGSPNAEKFIKNAMRLLDEIEKTSSMNQTDADVLLAKLQNMQDKLRSIEFSYIEVYFERGSVVGVEFNSKFSAERGNDVKWNVKGDKRQKLTIIPGEIPYGETPYSAELYAQIFYVDGSYKLSRIENVTAAGNAERGWTIEWSDNWGRYFRSIKESADKSSVIARGDWDQNIGYVINNAHGGVDGYSLKILAKNSSVDGSMAEFDFDAYKNSIIEVTVSEGITRLPSGVFANFKNLTSVNLPRSLTEIGESVFQGCSRLTSVTLPNNITAIGAKAFYGCSSLTEINLPDVVESIGNSAFWGCLALTSIKLPQETRITLGDYAFYGSGLKEIIIPDGVMSVGNRAFANCDSLAIVRWYSQYITQWNHESEGVFANTPNLTTVVVGGSECIPPKLFSGCSSITTVTLYSNVIGEEAFRNCSSLSILNFSTIDYVYDYAFAGCTSLTSISINGSVGKGAFEGCTGLRSLNLTYTHWAYDAEVGDRAFYGCSSLTNVTLSEDVAQIGRSAFEGCISLAEIDLSNVYYIYPYAFSGCSKLNSVTLYWDSWRLAPDSDRLDEQFNITVSSNYDAAIKLRSTYTHCYWFFK